MTRRFLFVLLGITLILTACGAPQATPSLGDAWACEQAQSPNWGGGGLGDAYYPLWGNGGLDVQHYDVSLSLDAAQNQVNGDAILDITATQALDAFNLDFLGMEISKLQVNGVDAKYCRNNFGELTIIPTTQIANGETFRVEVLYSGTPASKKSDVLGYSVGWLKNEKENAFFAFSSPEIPSFLYPANEYHTDSATYDFKVTVPETLQVFATGTLKGNVKADGKLTSEWEVSEPIVGSTFISIGEYQAEKTLDGPDGLKVSLNFTNSVNEKTQAKFEIIPEMLTVFSKEFGAFPYNGLGVTWVDDLPVGGITIPGRIFINSGSVEKLMSHELPREWFGVSVVPAAVEDTWLTQGMASYASAFLWDEHIGTDISDSINSEYANLPLSTGAPAVAKTYEATSDVVYFRSAIALHALRVHVGDEVFFNILKAFTAKYKNKIFHTADFITVANEVSGQKLDDFFKAWLYEEPIPDIPEMSLSKGNE